MMWLRRIAAAPLLLVAFICVVGVIKAITHQLPDDTVGTGIFTAVLAIIAVVAAFFLLRPDLVRLREVTFADLRHWMYTNPLGQATALYVIATALMAILVKPDYLLLPGLLAMCIYTVASTWTAARQQRWWAHAGVALVAFCLLLLALAATAEAITPRGFGEGGMLFLLPMYGFPILLMVSGIVRLVRGARET